MEEIKLTYDQVIESSIGKFGLWQFFVTLITFSSKIPTACHLLNIIIINPPMNFTCINNATDKCSANCTQHKFDRTEFDHTIKSQWDLVCTKSHLIHLAQTMTMVGTLIGNPLCGYLSDKYGRFKPFVICTIVQLILGCVSAYTPWYWPYVVLRLLISIANGGIMINSFVILNEVIGAKLRIVFCMLYFIPIGLGNLLLVLLAYVLRDWRMMILIISLTSLLGLTALCLLPESPRWALINGKVEKTIKIIEKAAKMNRRPTEGIREKITRIAEEKNDERSKANFCDLVRTREMCKRTLCIGYNWFSTGCSFYGMHQYTSQMSGDYYRNIALVALLSFPTPLIIYFLVTYVGRKYSLIIGNCLGVLSMLVIVFYPTGTVVQVAFAAIGVLAYYMNYCTIYLYTAELCPTNIRNIGVGTASMIARIGSLLAPFVIDLSEFTFEWVAPAIFCIITTLGIVLGTLLPETRKKDLPDSVQEAIANR